VLHALQLQQLDGVEVAVGEKVEVSNLVGAATDELVLIRKHFFPHGELEDGGGAIPPTAAGVGSSGHRGFYVGPMGLALKLAKGCCDKAAGSPGIELWVCMFITSAVESTAAGCCTVLL
jgi:hypothetical protein